MWCWRKLLGIPWTARRTNESVRHEIGKKGTLIESIIKQKLQYFEHIARRDGDSMEKIIMFGKVEGKRKRGRQRLRWIDGISGATNRPIIKCYNEAQDRQEWRHLRMVTSTQI
ncbi:uncharacterized protein [Antedon mediterranea]|uniref:uncharacterized protein n=1 Tax=Antedon mediterranea TaxID=105859 RepID=UPI003AF54B13